MQARIRRELRALEDECQRMPQDEFDAWMCDFDEAVFGHPLGIPVPGDITIEEAIRRLERRQKIEWWRHWLLEGPRRSASLPGAYQG